MAGLAEYQAVVKATPVVSSLPAKPEGALIGTHSGSFHCDEALACGMLKMLPAFRDAPILRSRVAAQWALTDVLVDVGGEYDASRGRFDHHQPSFKDTYSPAHDIRLSSAGLIFKHYGAEVVKAVAGDAVADEKTLAKLVLRTYDSFVREQDAIDNGVEVAEGTLRYRVGTGLASRVGQLNPAWNEESSDAVLNDRFRAAVLLAGTELHEYITRTVTMWLPARSIVQAARAKATSVHPSGSILVLDRFCPWKDHLFELEAEEAAEGAGAAATASAGAAASASAPTGSKALYALFQDVSGSWRIQAVPSEPNGFACRKPLPAAWAGLRDEELAAAAGVPDAVFVHAARFIGGAKSYEGVLKMAVQAVEAAAE